MTDKTPKKRRCATNDSALAKTAAIVRAAGINVVVDTDKTVTLLFLGPKGAAAMDKLIADKLVPEDEPPSQPDEEPPPPASATSRDVVCPISIAQAPMLSRLEPDMAAVDNRRMLKARKRGA